MPRRFEAVLGMICHCGGAVSSPPEWIYNKKAPRCNTAKPNGSPGRFNCKRVGGDDGVV
ncbi:MAG: hypothetical protein ABIA92_05015 [Patescibacteria group bacterium]